MNTRYQKLAAAIAQLSKAQERFDQFHSSELFDALRDSLIKRFEFSYELFWKCLKDHLAEEFGITSRSPREVFKEAFDKGIVSNDEFPLLLNMIDDRNRTSHTYDEKTAEEIADSMPQHLAIMQQIEQRVFAGK